MPTLFLPLTPVQAKALHSGKGVKYVENDEAQVYQIEMDTAMYKRACNARRLGKAFILKGAVVHGGDVAGGKIDWKGVGRTLKKGINTVGVDAIEGAKKVIPKKAAAEAVGDALGAATLAGTTMLGAPQPQLAQAARQVGKSAVNATYETDFRKRDALKQYGVNLGKDMGKAAIEQAGAAAVSGGRLVKGSEEARARMAHLRSLKGKGMAPLGGHGMAPLGGRGMAPLGGRGMAPLGGRGMVPL